LPAWSCGERPNSDGSLSPPADLLSHPDEPEMTADSLTSEKAYEDQRNAKIEWGRGNASVIDRACWWFQDAGVKSLSCPKRP
jgi:hypothetical protein